MAQTSSILSNKLPISFIKSQLKISKVEIFLVSVLLIFGVTGSLIIPLGAGTDEETHLMRVWEMSAFKFIPNESLGKGMFFPTIYWNFSYRRQLIVRPVDPDFYAEYSKMPIYGLDLVYENLTTRSVYSPPLLLPQALVMRYLGRGSDLPALTVFYLCRIAGLLSYIFLGWLAVRLMPYGKWILAALIASPAALFQASTVTADSISNGIGFFFLAGSLALTYKKEIGWKEWATLVVLFFILFIGKVNLVFLAVLPFLLLKPSRFRMKGGYFLLAGAAIVLCVIEIGGWASIAYSRLNTVNEEVSPTGQLLNIVKNPLSFAGTVVTDFWSNGADYFVDWIAEYGYGYYSVPAAAYLFFLLAVFFALFIRPVDKPCRRERTILLGGFFLGYLVTVLSMYASFTPVGSNEVIGIQGRYFLPVMPLLLLPLTGLFLWKGKSLPAWPVVVFSIASLAAFFAGSYLSYHVVCGSKYYEFGLCYQPFYKNWAPDARYSTPLSDQFSLTQEITPECDGAAEMRFWVDGSGSDPDGSTQVRLYDPGRDLVLFEQTVQNSEAPEGDYLVFPFESDWESEGQSYILDIQNDAIPGEQGIRVAYTIKPEYDVGYLYENDQAVEHDIVFRYGCAAGLEKLLRSRNP